MFQTLRRLELQGNSLIDKKVLEVAEVAMNYVPNARLSFGRHQGEDYAVVDYGDVSFVIYSKKILACTDTGSEEYTFEELELLLALKMLSTK